MTTVPVSNENNKYARQFKSRKNVNQLGRAPDENLIVSNNVTKSICFNEIGPANAQPSPPKQALIEKCLKRLVKSRLYGRPHVKGYLYALYRRGCRANTIRSNFSAIFLFLSHLRAFGKHHLETIAREDISGFIEHEQDRGLAPNTVATRLRALYAFMGYLAEAQIIDADVIKKKMRIKVADTLPKAIDPEDVKQLLAVIRKLRDRALILVLLRTGMRIGELLATRLYDVNLPESRIEIIEAEKNRVGRVVYLSDDAMRALKLWLKRKKRQTPYVFDGHRGRPLGYEAARMVFIKYLDASGLSHKGYTLHCLRHTYASELLNAGMRLECVQQLLGHRCIEMTRRYARLTDNTRREEYFIAMKIIERGGIHGHYRRDPTLSKIFEEAQLFGPHD
jgi:integrase/recombinase XerD